MQFSFHISLYDDQINKNEHDDGNWIIDFGTSNHITKDIDNFCDAQEYTDNSKVFIDNMEQLPISHIGMVELSTPNGVIPLKNN